MFAFAATVGGLCSSAMNCLVQAALCVLDALKIFALHCLLWGLGMATILGGYCGYLYFQGSTVSLDYVMSPPFSWGMLILFGGMTLLLGFATTVKKLEEKYDTAS